MAKQRFHDSSKLFVGSSWMAVSLVEANRMVAEANVTEYS